MRAAAALDGRRSQESVFLDDGVTGDPQEYVWGLVDIKPHGTTTFDQTELLGQEFSISATPGCCSIHFVEKNLGKQTVRSAVYTMPAYLEPNKPFQPALPVSHSDFEFYCMLDGMLGFSLNADGTAFTYNNKNGLPPPGESTTVLYEFEELGLFDWDHLSRILSTTGQCSAPKGSHRRGVGLSEGEGHNGPFRRLRSGEMGPLVLDLCVVETGASPEEIIKRSLNISERRPI